MKKTIYINMLSIALVAVAAGCTKSDELSGSSSDEAQSQYVSINISVDDVDTRVGVDGFEVNWAASDKILFYNSNSRQSAASTYSLFSIDEESIDGKSATFAGTISSGLAVGKLSGIYPGEGVITNFGGATTMFYNALRLVQPSYLTFEYDAEGQLLPESVGKYCYMHLCSDEYVFSSGTDISTINGKMKHLMSFMDINLSDVSTSKKVERVYISMDTRLKYPSIKVSTTGSVTYDEYVDYVMATSGSSAYELDSNYFVVELTGDDGELGVSASTIPLRIPLFPQTLSGEWTLFVCYEDGSEDVTSINVDGAVLKAGIIYNANDTKSLSGATSLATATPKIGDIYYSDNSYSTGYVEKSGRTPEAVVYELNRAGATTTISKVVGLFYQKCAFYTDSLVGVDVASSELYGSVNNTTGLENMQALLTLAKANVSALENKTAEEIFPTYFPAFDAVSKINDSYPTSFSADDTGVWYIPSLKELAKMLWVTASLQGHNTLFVAEQLSTMPTIYGGGTQSSSELTLDVANTYYKDGSAYYSTFTPVTSVANEFGSSSTSDSGSNLYMLMRNLYFQLPGSDSYISPRISTSVKDAMPSYIIKRIN